MSDLPSYLAPSGDPEPVEHVNPGAKTPVLLVCEHAGQAIPARLGGLGLAPGDIDLHIGWDVGAAAVTRAMAARLDCPAVLQRFSRLVIDCNRPPSADDAIPAVSDGISVPANDNPSAEERGRRVSEIFLPFQDAVTAARQSRPALMLSIHSFTPRKATDAKERPWHLGFLFRKDTKTSAFLAADIARRRPDLTIGFNEPYSIDDASDWFVPEHGERSGLAHSLIEIRHDLIRDEAGQQAMAALLSDAVNAYLEASC